MGSEVTETHYTLWWTLDTKT